MTFGSLRHFFPNGLKVVGSGCIPEFSPKLEANEVAARIASDELFLFSLKPERFRHIRIYAERRFIPDDDKIK